MRQKAIQMIAEKYGEHERKYYKERGAFQCFGENVFNREAQKKMLAPKCFETLQKTIHYGDPLQLDIAEAVAKGMREWAISKGATHYCHWFQPLTDLTAEKHDSFFTTNGKEALLMEFEGKHLIRGEPDASSFPSGGLRTTFEARGYTIWDPSSPPFLLGRTLVIPSLFLSWSGEALDEKTPLLRSMDALHCHALRFLRLFGDQKTKRVIPTVGAEQEYFLIDTIFFLMRPDLRTCGRTLFGAKPPKGQELEDQYLGSIPARILGIMEEVEFELLRLGVPIKTRHNEVAPSQYELALSFERANLAADHYMLLMDILKGVAQKHSMNCLLHEKPFANINGSGKHNNWSLATDSGRNLLEPGETPHENLQFLFFCLAIVRAVYQYAPLLRASIASAGNDHRLGKHEAPPAIMSIFLGHPLYTIFHNLANPQAASSKELENNLLLGISMLPNLPRHTSDRNRTCPFAFTGNKFEFRAVGSSENVARANTVLNTIVAASLDDMTTELEKKMQQGLSLDKAVKEILVQESKHVQPILFEGDNYHESWIEEAKTRGLPNITNTVDAVKYYTTAESVSLFKKYGVMNERELESRQEILLEKYVKKILIEAKTASQISHTMIIPSIIKYLQLLLECSKGMPEDGKEMFDLLSSEFKKFRKALLSLDEAIHKLPQDKLEIRACYMRDEILTLLSSLRSHCDRMEEWVADDLWTLPKYGEMLFIR